MEFMQAKMTASNGSDETTDWGVSKEETIATWHFVMLDKNKNKVRYKSIFSTKDLFDNKKLSVIILYSKRYSCFELILQIITHIIHIEMFFFNYKKYTHA